ncbi:MAG: hypothetical protein JO072_16050 [Parafilimonas sp.]|nr:hypothetical protein [Parafilimonas sp.]
MKKYVKLTFLFMITLLIAKKSNAQIAEQTNLPTDSTKLFIENSIKLLSKGKKLARKPAILSKDSVLNFWYRCNEEFACDSSVAENVVFKRITELSKQEDVSFNVNILTKKDGAIIKYQAVYDRDNNGEIIEAKNPTNNCIEQIYLGVYYIWSERNNVATSDKNRKVFINNKNSITINESK